MNFRKKREESEEETGELYIRQMYFINLKPTYSYVFLNAAKM